MIAAERNKLTLDAEIVDLKLKALRAQMNPHFTFNVMNSIQYYLGEKDIMTAQNYISKFAKLIREILDNSESSVILIKDELDALSIYLELEKMRFMDRFEYIIDISDEVNIDDWHMPSMLIQPFVENAVKHAFEPGKPNMLRISFKQKDDNYFYCIIEDNGIGINKAKALRATNKFANYHESKGLAITAERIKNYNIMKHCNASFTISDTSLGAKTGTKVEFILPIIDSYP